MVSVADPEKPVALSDLADLLSSDDETTEGPRSPAWGKIAAFAVVCLALTALWKYTPLATFLDGNHITGWARRAGDEWWVPILTVLAYTPVAFTMFPRPLITLFAVIAFGPLLGFVYAMLGIELSAWVSFVLGKKMDRNTVRRIAGTKLNGILQVLRRRGLLAMTALRLVPIAPFVVEGVVAGAVRVKLSDFMIGTALGMLPGTLTSTVFGDQLQVWLEDPSRINYWLIALRAGASRHRDLARAALARCFRAVGLATRRWWTRGLTASRAAAATYAARRVAIGSYNIHSCVGWDRRRPPSRIAAVLKELDCDIYALQEVDNERGRRRGLDAARVSVARAGHGRGSGPAHRSSQRPVRQRDADAPADRQRASSRSELLAVRAARRARRASSISATTTLRVIATHLGLSRSERRSQWRHLLKAVAAAPRGAADRRARRHERVVPVLRDAARCAPHSR